MEVRFSSLAPSTRVVDIDEADMAALYDLVADYFLSMLPFMELNKYNAYMQEKVAIADFASKYGVPVDHAPSLVNFYRAALGRPNEQRDSDTRPKLAVAK
jgi:CO dehydrogenase/acetyl-CoA synthase alpha subunit